MLETESQIDILIEYLKQAAQPEHLGECHLSESAPPCPAQVRLYSEGQLRREAIFPAEAYLIDKEELRFRCSGDQARSQRIEVAVTTSRNVEGESQLVLLAAVLRTIKVTGGYEFSAGIQRLREHFRPAHRIFAESVAHGDISGWNQWYAAIQQAVDLKRLNLAGLNLSQFDLGSANLTNCDLRNANLSGANLSGANLDGCILDGAVVEGADFFGAAIPRKYESLLKASGLLERESVIFIDE